MAEQIEKQKVKVGEAKGRPMLHWVGRKALDYVTAFPGQLVETFNPTSEENEAQGLLFHGDAKEMLAYLLANGFRKSVDLVYIDPPFNTGADSYVRTVRLRRAKGRRVAGQPESLGEQIQYASNLLADNYLQLMYERMQLLGQLMKDDAVICVRMDYHFGHYVKILLDELFGKQNFINEVVVGRQRETVGSTRKLDITTESIFVYGKSNNYFLNKVETKRALTDIKWTSFLMGGEREPRNRVFFGLDLTPPAGQHFSLVQEKCDKLVAENYIRLRCKSCRALYYHAESYESFVKRIKHKKEKFKFYDLTSETIFHAVASLERCLECDQTEFAVEYLGSENVRINSNWLDIRSYARSTGYPTENSKDLLERLIRSFCPPGGLVLDCFVGSGTSPVVAQALGYRWIAGDINKGAVQTTSKRLQTVIKEQIKRQPTPAPAALSFSVWRVNDYDLQIQHNEAVNLVVEHIGIERTRTDPFFDGTLGKRLVKIVPFNHALTLLDLQLVRDELKARPDEDRDIVIVSLGKETAVDPELEKYNKHRAINKIEVIELRTHQKYGKFFVHQPAHAEVNIERQDKKIVVEIEDFISPTIVERLEMDTPLFKVEIPDWRAMVDAVLIDASYDGEVFDITLSDVPEKKDDLVQGQYQLDAPDGETRVAVKMIDMLGEEVISTITV